MTLFDFICAVKRDELNDRTIKQKWDTLCDVLKAHNAEAIKQMILEDALDGFDDIEANDGFGTEGMSL
jgi:hypothetical protein